MKHKFKVGDLFVYYSRFGDYVLCGRITEIIPSGPGVINGPSYWYVYDAIIDSGVGLGRMNKFQKGSYVYNTSTSCKNMDEVEDIMMVNEI